MLPNWVTWLTIVGAFLGAVTSFITVWQWWEDCPKIEGEVEQMIVGEIHEKGTGKFLGVNVMMQVYLVNTRIHPTTIKGWDLKVQIDSQDIHAKMNIIPDDINLEGVGPIDWSKNKLYDTAWKNTLEREKPMRGWLRFVFDGLDKKKIVPGTKFTLTMTDSIGRTYFITYMYAGVNGQLMYYPDSGVQY